MPFRSGQDRTLPGAVLYSLRLVILFRYPKIHAKAVFKFSITLLLCPDGAFDKAPLKTGIVEVLLPLVTDSCKPVQ